MAIERERKAAEIEAAREVRFRDVAPGTDGSMTRAAASAIGQPALQLKIARRLQRKQNPDAASPADAGVRPSLHEAAKEGTKTSGQALPHLERIQRAFGHHDLSGVQAHIGGEAANAADTIGAQAFTHGEHVAFAEAPSLFVAAHEAAHVVQQRRGVNLEGGVGNPGDAYEQHADAVAQLVVEGKSAEALLDGRKEGQPGPPAKPGSEEDPKAIQGWQIRYKKAIAF